LMGKRRERRGSEDGLVNWREGFRAFGVGTGKTGGFGVAGKSSADAERSDGNGEGDGNFQMHEIVVFL
jgi:hypothetical protein